MSVGQPDREDLAATLGVRREMGPEYDDALAEGFLERLDRRLDVRVETAVEQRLGSAPSTTEDRSDGSGNSLALGIVSLGTAIPLSAIASSGGDSMTGLVVAWVGIVGVNAAHALGRRRSR